MTLTGCRIAGNATIGWGGGIYTDGGTLDLIDSRVGENRADENGAGIYIGAGTVTLDDSDVTGNTADSSGGIYNSELIELTLVNGSASRATRRTSASIVVPAPAARSTRGVGDAHTHHP